MVSELAVETFRVMWTIPSDYFRDNVSWSGPFDCLWFAPRCPIGSVKPFGDPGCMEPFLNLGAGGNNFALLSEVVISFFGDVVFQPFELLLPLVKGSFLSF